MKNIKDVFVGFAHKSIIVKIKPIINKILNNNFSILLK